MTDAPTSRGPRLDARQRKANQRTALVLFVVAIAFYFGMIFVGPLSR